MLMNINAITTILQELIYQSSQKASPMARPEGVTQVRDLTVASQKIAEAADIGSSVEQPGQVNAEQTTEQPFTVPAFVPLPLRSELFPEARYFARIGEDKTKPKTHKEVIEEIFICLFTEKLGQIWIGLACQKDYLHVTCYTEQKMANQIIRENSPHLREDLKTVGFKEVSLTTQVKAELAAILEGQLPKFEEHFLNRII